MLSAPLIARGQVIGVINTMNKRYGNFTEDDIRLLSLLANQAARIDVGLKVGSASTKIEVTADATQLNVDNGRWRC